MASFVTHVAFDMDVEFGYVNSDGDVTVVTRSRIEVVNGEERTIYSGRYTLNSEGGISSGMITGIKEYLGPALQATLTGASVNLDAYFRYIENNDPVGLGQQFLRG